MSATNTRTVAAVAASVALSVLLAACSNDDENTPSGATDTTQSQTAAETSTQHNDADVEFAQMMILHHQGALDMAVAAEGRAKTEAVQDIAARIQFAQQPEIDLMTSWLEAWGEEPPSGEDDMGGMDHSGGHTGMADADQMQQLEDAGPEFDRMFLEMMIVHHQGAITMAEEQQANGENPQAIELAGTIVADQSDEIAEMEQLLAGM
jgi:uncharacterized protein (DUF305 family)